MFHRRVLTQNETGESQTKTKREEQRETNGASATHSTYFTLSRPDGGRQFTWVLSSTSYFALVGHLADTPFYPLLIGELRVHTVRKGLFLDRKSAPCPFVPHRCGERSSLKRRHRSYLV